MKKFTSKSIVLLAELTLLALLLTEAYLNHREEIDGSLMKLKAALEEKGEQTNE